MSTEDIQNSAAADQAKPTISKAEQVRKLLSRTRGATVEEIIAATTWQPHSVRAFLSGVRKKGGNVVKEERKNGATSYRIIKPVKVVEPAASIQGA